MRDKVGKGGGGSLQRLLTMLVSAASSGNALSLTTSSQTPTEQGL